MIFRARNNRVLNVIRLLGCNDKLILTKKVTESVIHVR